MEPPNESIIYPIPALNTEAVIKLGEGCEDGFVLEGQGVVIMIYYDKGIIIDTLGHTRKEFEIPATGDWVKTVVPFYPEGFGVLLKDGDFIKYDLDGNVLFRKKIKEDTVEGPCTYFPPGIIQCCKYDHESTFLHYYGRIHKCPTGSIITGSGGMKWVPILALSDPAIGYRPGSPTTTLFDMARCREFVVLPGNGVENTVISPDGTRLAVRRGKKIDIYRIEIR